MQRLGQNEVVDHFDRELALALRLSAAEAQDSPTLQNNPTLTPASARVEPLLQSDIACAASSNETQLGESLMCNNLPSASSALDEVRSASVKDNDMQEDSAVVKEKVPGVTPAAKGRVGDKSAATPAASSIDVSSARGTKKKRPRLDESEDESETVAAAHVSPVDGVLEEQQVRKRKIIGESDDEDQIPPAAAEASSRTPSSNPGHPPSRGGEHEEVTNQKASEHKEASKQRERGGEHEELINQKDSEHTQASNQREINQIESDMIPDSEDEDSETVRVLGEFICLNFDDWISIAGENCRASREPTSGRAELEYLRLAKGAFFSIFELGLLFDMHLGQGQKRKRRKR